MTNDIRWYRDALQRAGKLANAVEEMLRTDVGSELLDLRTRRVKDALAEYNEFLLLAMRHQPEPTTKEPA